MRSRIIGLFLLVFLSACTQQSSTGTSPTGPSAPTVTSVTVTGALGIASVGLTSQMTATAHFAKGTTQNVTNQATWSSSDAKVATVSAGLVTAVGVGTATITATYNSVSGLTRISVNRPATYILSGQVTESAPTTSTMLSGARIEFTDSSNQGRFAITDASGRYQITLVPPGTYNLRATLAGYVESTKQVAVNTDAIADFALAPTPISTWFTRTGSITGTNAACYDNRPCEIFALPPVHNSGPLYATLLWNNLAAVLALQLYNVDTGQVVFSASSTAGQTSLYLGTQIQAPGNYQLRVVAVSAPGSVGLTLNVTACPN